MVDSGGSAGHLLLTKNRNVNTKKSVFMQTILQAPSFLAFIILVSDKTKTDEPQSNTTGGNL